MANNGIVAREFIAPRYMTRFRCLGSECKDTCCGWWNVPVDEQHYRKLEQVMGGSEESRDAFSQTFIRQDNGSKDAFAHIRMGSDGYCRFLGRDLLCTIQKECGADVMPDICMLYPRMVSLVGERLELAGQLSCPETARLCLLAEDALGLMDFDPAVLSRPRFFQILRNDRNDDPYAWYFDDIRATLLELLSCPGFPLSSRLYFMLYFAGQVSPFFFRGVKEMDESKLAAEINAVRRPEVRKELHAAFVSITDAMNPIMMEAVQRLLLSRMQHANCRPGYSKMIVDVFVGYEQEHGNATLDPSKTRINLTLPPVRILQQYLSRRNYWSERHGEKIERYIRNYAMNYILTAWYTGWQDLVAYMRSLLIRTAAVRFLMFSARGLYELTRSPSSQVCGMNDEVVGLERAAVEACYNFTRNIGHSPELDKLNETLLDGLHLRTLEDLIPLTGF